VDVAGSASANYFLCVYQDYGGSYLDCLHALDRNVTSSYYPGKCLSATGCYTFFPRQGSSMPTWMNSGTAAFIRIYTGIVCYRTLVERYFPAIPSAIPAATGSLKSSC
jgi:hypothetical protein